jgi:hypothetical protein
MASREHLVPTLTVDKNGRTTTVHKKPVVEGAQKSIPMVKVQGPLPRRKEMLKSIIERMGMGRTVEAKKTVARQLSKYPDSILEKIVQEMTSTSQVYKLARNAVVNDVPVEGMSEMLTFVDELDASSYYAVRDHISSLHQYTQLPESTDFSNEDDETVAKCRALLKVQRACAEVEDLEVFRLESGYFVIDDDDLVELVLNHPDKASHIADFIRERQGIDVALMAEAFASGTSALGSGTL